MANGLRKIDSAKSNSQLPPSTDLFSREDLWSRLKRGRQTRDKFTESHLNKNLAFQLRALRDREGWSQQELADKVGMNQNAISRLENPGYGKPTITTLKRLAAAFDVALIVRFVPFSEMVHWVSGTPYLNPGLRADSLAVPSFDMEESRSEAERKVLLQFDASKKIGLDFFAATIEAMQKTLHSRAMQESSQRLSSSIASFFKELSSSQQLLAGSFRLVQTVRQPRKPPVIADAVNPASTGSLEKPAEFRRATNG